jgi:hypothetical protein
LLNPIILTQCFCKASILEFSLKNLYENLSKEREHWILLKHYPIHEKENTEEIIKYAKQYGCKIHDSGCDNGAHEGLNQFFDSHPELINRGYIGFDPDTLVQDKGFDQALVDVMNERKDIIILGLSNAGMHPDCAFTAHEHIKNKFNLFLQYKQIIAGHNVIVHPGIDMVNCCMINAEWVLNRKNRFYEYRKYYGGLEHYLWTEMQQDGKTLGYLIDYKERYDGIMEQHKHAEYQQWKQDHLKGFQGSLSEWLISKGKGDLLE